MGWGIRAVERVAPIAAWLALLCAGACREPVLHPGVLVLDQRVDDLGNVAFYDGVVAQSLFTVANLGPGDVQLTAIELEGPGADFVALQEPGALPLLEPGQLLDMFASLQPGLPESAALGDYTVDLSVTGDSYGPVEVRGTIGFRVVNDCDVDHDGHLALVCGGGDCDDSAKTIHPGAEELCDGVDNDCTGIIDDAIDADADGANLCEDCDDDDERRYPGNVERCDGIDNDCDLRVDVDAVDSVLMWFDGDGDGFGDPNEMLLSCPRGPAWVRVGLDCNDRDELSYPGALDICDLADNDCDGDVDEDCFEICDDGVDNDLDGLADCDDDDCYFDCHTCPEERCGSGIDDDGDGLIDCDDPDCASSGCAEDCSNGRDDDADGLVDCEDGDCVSTGSCGEVSCDDGLDDDGDGLTDCEDDDCWGLACAPNGWAITWDQGTADVASAWGSDNRSVWLDVNSAHGYVQAFHSSSSSGTCEFSFSHASFFFRGGSADDVMLELQSRGALTLGSGCQLAGDSFLPQGLKLQSQQFHTTYGVNSSASQGATWYAGSTSVGASGSASASWSIPSIEAGDTTVCPRWYMDNDHDGYGTWRVWTAACGDPAAPDPGLSLNQDDCDDRKDAIHPGVTEICGDGIDNNCDGVENGCGGLGNETVAGPGAGAFFEGASGSSGQGRVVKVGDLTDTGFPDVALVDLGDSASTIWLFEGAFCDGNYAATDAAATITSSSEWGDVILGVGDATGDGVHDLIVGSTSGAGRLGLYQGPVSGALTQTSALLYLSGENSGDGYGVTRPVGDLTADGVADLIVGAPAAYSGDGRVYVHTGALSGTTVSDSLDGVDGDGDALGSTVTGLVDLDLDGQDDFMVGTSGGSFYGFTTLPVGRLGTSDADYELTRPADAVDDVLDLVSIGDWGSDGYDDLVLLDRAGGRMWVLPSTHNTTIDPDTDYQNRIIGTFTQASVTSADIDSDGHNDLIVTMPDEENDGVTSINYAPFTLTKDDVGLLQLGFPTVVGSNNSSTDVHHIQWADGGDDWDDDGDEDLLVGGWLTEADGTQRAFGMIVEGN